MDWGNSVSRRKRQNGPPRVVVERHVARQERRDLPARKKAEHAGSSFKGNSHLSQIETELLPPDLLSTLKELEKLKYSRNELQKLQSTVGRLRGLTAQYEQSFQHHHQQEREDFYGDESDGTESEHEYELEGEDQQEQLRSIMKHLQEQSQEIKAMRNEINALNDDRRKPPQNTKFKSERSARRSSFPTFPQSKNTQNQRRSIVQEFCEDEEEDEEEETERENEESDNSADSPLEEFSDSAYRNWKEGKLQFINNVPVRTQKPSYPYEEVVAAIQQAQDENNELEETARLLEHYRNQLQQAQREAANLSYFNDKGETSTDADGEEGSDEEESKGGEDQTTISSGEELLQKLSENWGESLNVMTIEEIEEMMTYLGNEITNSISPFLGTPIDGAFLLSVLRMIASVKQRRLEKEFLSFSSQWLSAHPYAQQSERKSTATSPTIPRKNNSNSTLKEKSEKEMEVNEITSAGLFASEYTDEIFANEIITKKLDLQILDFLEVTVKEENQRTFSKENLEVLENLTVNAIRDRTQLMDSELAECVHLLINSYLGKEIHLHKDMLISSVADLLFDEMVFSKVILKVDKSYVEEIKDLQEEEGLLLKQREEDITKLRLERRQRLNSIQSIPSENSRPPVSPHSFEKSAQLPLNSIDSDSPSFVNCFLNENQNSDELKRGFPTVTTDDELGGQLNEDFENEEETFLNISLSKDQQESLQRYLQQEKKDLILQFIDSSSQLEENDDADPNQHPTSEFKNGTIEDTTEAIISKDDTEQHKQI